jgi:D-serine deaminase-like pyridoxal phosphate-dependent protein
VKIEQPSLLLDEQICRSNIIRIARNATNSNVVFRPHFKTHQSAEIGEWFREAGAEKITVSSVTMAEYFAQAGWKDILIAFPLNIIEIEKINSLGRDINLSILIESRETAEFLIENITSRLTLYIKIDTGNNRTGIWWEDMNLISAVIDLIKKSSLLKFAGFVSHSGHTYQASNSAEIVQIYHDTLKKLNHLKKEFSSIEINPIISIGDTPSCSVINDFTGVDEIRPGNFVFYDLMQYKLDSCSLKDIAVVLACPVVAKHANRNEIVIYGGAIHLSKDFITDSNGCKLFGLVVRLLEHGWSEPLPGTYVKALSQEHGIISTTNEILSRIKPGDVIGILPIHSCLTAHQMRHYFTLDGKHITTMNS